MYKKLAIGILIAAPVMALVADEFTRNRHAAPVAETQNAQQPPEDVTGSIFPNQPPPQAPSTFGEPMAGAGMPMSDPGSISPAPPNPSSAPTQAYVQPASQPARVEVNPIPDPRQFPNSGIRVTTYQADD